jgi:hypothetical protein
MTIAIANLFELQSFQGKLYEAVRDTAGLPAGFRWVGNASEVKYGLQTEEVVHKESYSGNRLEDGVLVKPSNATLSFILDTLSKGNVEMGGYSSQVSNAGAAITGEVQASGLVVGDYFFTKHGNISAVAVKDSTGSPVTLTLNTHYSIDDVIYGRLKLLSLSGIVQPLKLDYTYGQEILFPFFATAGSERYFRFEGVNTAVTPNKPLAAEFYRVKPKPFSEFQLISEEYGKYQIEARVLADLTRAADPNFLQFGRYIPLA